MRALKSGGLLSQKRKVKEVKKLFPQLSSTKERSTPLQLVGCKSVEEKFPTFHLSSMDTRKGGLKVQVKESPSLCLASFSASFSFNAISASENPFFFNLSMKSWLKL